MDLRTGGIILVLLDILFHILVSIGILGGPVTINIHAILENYQFVYKNFDFENETILIVSGKQNLLRIILVIIFLSF